MSVVLGIGSAHIDLFLKVDKKTFESFKSSRSRHLRLEDFNRFAKTKGIQILPGGCAANTIRGLSHLGRSCAFLSCVGRDPEGELFLANLKKLKIRSEVSVKPGFSTIRLLCLVGPEGEKRILYPNQTEPPTVFTPTHFKDAGWIHVDAFQFEVGNDLDQAMKLAGCRASFNLGNAEIAAEYREKILSFLKSHAEIVFGNESEFQALTGLSGEEGRLKLQEICPIAVMTRGPKGCLIVSRKQVFSQSGLPVKMVDATGAGDYFASGFLYGYLNHFPLKRCAEIANLVGSALVEGLGTELPETTWERIRQIARKRKTG